MQVAVLAGERGSAVARRRVRDDTPSALWVREEISKTSCQGLAWRLDGAIEISPRTRGNAGFGTGRKTRVRAVASATVVAQGDLPERPMTRAETQVGDRLVAARHGQDNGGSANSYFAEPPPFRADVRAVDLRELGSTVAGLSADIVQARRAARPRHTAANVTQRAKSHGRRPHEGGEARYLPAVIAAARVIAADTDWRSGYAVARSARKASAQKLMS